MDRNNSKTGKLSVVIILGHYTTCWWLRARYNFVAALIFTIAIFPTRVMSAVDLSHICDRAAVFAAEKSGVPISVLQAISLTETGRKRNGVLRPWPWTVNMEGEGVWFETADEARAYVYKHYKEGARSFDVGCFQINYKWHGHEFASIEEMFQPNPNALYAAEFLLKLYHEKGDWAAAAGAYHSRTQKYAEKYEKQFSANRAAMLGRDAIIIPVTATGAIASSLQAPKVNRINNFPLLQENSNARTLGSLVPLGAQQLSRRLITADADDG